MSCVTWPLKTPTAGLPHTGVWSYLTFKDRLWAYLILVSGVTCPLKTDCGPTSYWCPVLLLLKDGHCEPTSHWSEPLVKLALRELLGEVGASNPLSADDTLQGGSDRSWEQEEHIKVLVVVGSSTSLQHLWSYGLTIRDLVCCCFTS